MGDERYRPIVMSKLKNEPGQPGRANDAGEAISQNFRTAFKAEMSNVGTMGVSHALTTASFSTGMTMMMMADPGDPGGMYVSPLVLGILSFVLNVFLIGFAVYRRKILNRASRFTDDMMKTIRCLQKGTMLIIIVQVVLQVIALVLMVMHMKDMASSSAEYPVTNVTGPPHQKQEDVVYGS